MRPPEPAVSEPETPAHEATTYSDVLDRAGRYCADREVDRPFLGEQGSAH